MKQQVYEALKNVRLDIRMVESTLILNLHSLTKSEDELYEIVASYEGHAAALQPKNRRGLRFRSSRS